MSVINQMLKDLDKRQSEQQAATNHAVPQSSKTSTSKIIIVVTMLIILNVVGLFGWQLYTENQQLKSQAQQQKIDAQQAIKSDESLVVVGRADTQLTPEAKVQGGSDEQQNDVPQPTTINTTINENITAKNALHESNTGNNELIDTITANEHSAAVTVDNGEVLKSIEEPEPLIVAVPAKSSLTISRSQLSPQALATSKITEAEQAMERNDIPKAEALFEEVLLVMPEHETARKQLAALWYGKRYYQDAVNLLSQGIALAPEAEEMRIMSARIYYEQGQARDAYNILIPLKHSMNAEFQVLLANTAAQLNEHDSAIIAYRTLITLEPDMGRWFLGLAVSLDSLGKFLPAIDAYQQAIARNNLSSSATQFARQRLIELGE